MRDSILLEREVEKIVARTFDDRRMSWPQQLQIIGKDSHLHPRVALSSLYRVASAITIIVAFVKR
jgi:fumarate reductase subunit C